MQNSLFFDTASTTRCCPPAAACLQEFSTQAYGNPSSAHREGQKAARAIREARTYFAGLFGVEDDQIIFTGSGTEADNLAIYGVAMAQLADRGGSAPGRIIVSAIEHAAVKSTALSLASLGFDVQIATVDSDGKINRPYLNSLITPDTLLVSIMQVNNITGVIQPVEEIATELKQINPNLVFHTDAVQAFGKFDTPQAPSSVDLVSISAHKIHGPKGIGALAVLNRKYLDRNKLRPIIWGGGQEGGFRCGTQSAGLISGFHRAAQDMLQNRNRFLEHTQSLRHTLYTSLVDEKLIPNILTWNSPNDGAPHIVSLSIPGYPAATLANLLEEKGCVISTGSACSSKKVEPEAVLVAMGKSAEEAGAALRISLCLELQPEHIQTLVAALRESIDLMALLQGRK